jgi:hypothetical protein
MKQKDILLLAVPSVFFVLFWIGFGIYHYYRSSTTPEVLNTQVSDISPDFNTNTISSLKLRQQVTPLYQLSITSTITPSPTPTSLSIQATSSGQASPGGTLSL